MDRFSSSKGARAHFFDWLRMTACLTIVLIHCINMFSELYNAQADLRLPDLEAYGVTFIKYWCMDLFFLLAGASTWLALGKKTGGQYLQERLRRLLLPFLLGFFLLVPLQEYFEQVSNGQYAGTLAAYYLFFLRSIVLPGQWVEMIHSIHHLWFLLYLFIFSLISLPLFLFVRRLTKWPWQERLLVLCGRPGGLLLFLVPLLFVHLVLYTRFPSYCGPADALGWLLFYLEGYLLFSSVRFRRALWQQRRLLLVVICLSLTGILMSGGMDIMHPWLYHPTYTPGSLFFQGLSCATCWACVLMAFSFGERYLNRSNRVLAYARASSFLWYLLHFPLVVIAACCLLPLHLGALPTLLLLSGSALAATLLATDIVRRLSSLLSGLSTRSVRTVSHVARVCWLSLRRIRPGRGNGLEGSGTREAA